MSDSPHQSRRKFLKVSLQSTIVTGVGLSSLGPMLQSCSASKTIMSSKFITPFQQTPLPYAYDALKSVIDPTTMEIHYSKHAAAYSKNLLEAAKAKGISTSGSLEDLLPKVSQYSPKLRNNAGGHYNHELFWRCMRPEKQNNAPSVDVERAIEAQFTSFANFKSLFSEAAKSRFGSGWAWLYMDNKVLKIGSTANQDNPLMNVSDLKGFPLLGLDVWEHAYYLKYQNKRADYIDNWWKIVNWDYVDERYKAI